MNTEFDREYPNEREYIRICDEIYERMLCYEDIEEVEFYETDAIPHKVAITRLDNSHIRLITEANVFDEDKSPLISYVSMFLEYLNHKKNPNSIHFKNINNPQSFEDRVGDTIASFYANLIPTGEARMNKECSADDSIEQSNPNKIRKMK